MMIKNKAFWELWQRPMLLIALSDTPNQLKSCPFYVIGQANNLQPTVYRWDRYGPQWEERKRVEKFSILLLLSSREQGWRVTTKTSHSTQSSDSAPDQLWHSPKHQKWLTLKVAFPPSLCLFMDVIMWQVSQKVILNSEVCISCYWVSLCVFATKTLSHHMLPSLQGRGVCVCERLRLFGLVVFTDSFMFRTVDNTWEIRWLSEKAEGVSVIKKRQKRVGVGREGFQCQKWLFSVELPWDMCIWTGSMWKNIIRVVRVWLFFFTFLWVTIKVFH